MVEITFENLYPIAGLLIISVTIWGMSKKFTQMDSTIADNQKDNQRDFAINSKDIQELQKDLDCLKKEVKEISDKLIRLTQKIEDKLGSK